MSGPPCEFAPSTNETQAKKRKGEDIFDSVCLRKKAVVVLTRLSHFEISHQQFCIEDESPSSTESDVQWEPADDSSGSDCSKRQKKHKHREQTKASAKRAPATPKNNTQVPVVVPMIISTAFSLCPTETRKVRPHLPEEEVKEGMTVLARKKRMKWYQGKIVAILTMENGCQKYKIHFGAMGKILMSGHHIAFETTAKSEQLYVGARVVVRCQENKLLFRPAIIAELPTRKNRLRFLVFTDDHIPVYTGLPSLHLVCRPLENSLDDLPDSPHKSFMARYLRNWPYPQLIEYKAGESINVELNGVQQKCEVLEVDCSLLLVVFQDNRQKEWIYRGSMRLEHMAESLKW